MRHWATSRAESVHLRALSNRFALWRMAVASLSISAAAIAFPAELVDGQFVAEMNRSMMQMHQAMAVSPTGDIDADFVAMMVPHHQGAIDMARIELHYGHNEQLRRLAQQIIVDQQQEIAAMRYALRDSK
jgi:uncharacterized protein (DUF305 family)